MQVHYDVELSATAEKSYKQLHNDGEKAGDGSHEKASWLAIEQALDETIPANPLDTDLALAGRLSYIFKLSLDSVCIYYSVDTERRCVCVIHIGNPQNCIDRSWVKKAVLSGDFAGILQKLGVDKPNLLDETQSLWPH